MHSIRFTGARPSSEWKSFKFLFKTVLADVVSAYANYTLCHSCIICEELKQSEDDSKKAVLAVSRF